MLAIAAALAPLPANEIAPPLDTPIRQIQTEIRDDGRNRRTFRLERTFRFSAEPDGYRVVVTTISADAEASPADRDRYRVANRGLLGLAFAVHLDRSARLRSVDDLDSIWAAWASGLTTAQEGSATTTTDAAMKRLGALSNEQRMAFIGSIATAIIAPQDERYGAPERAVALASPPPFGAITLTGTKIATATGDQVVTRVTATGSSPAGDARISLASADTVDVKSGLLANATKRTTTSTRGGTLAVETRQTLTW